MSRLTKSDSIVNTNSTQTFESFELNYETVNSVAPHGLFYDDQEETCAHLLLPRQGEQPLPMLETKYKLKKGYNLAIKFRL